MAAARSVMGATIVVARARAPLIHRKRVLGSCGPSAAWPNSLGHCSTRQQAPVGLQNEGGAEAAAVRLSGEGWAVCWRPAP